jgi:YVTN family beta-propeller protein
VNYIGGDVSIIDTASNTVVGDVPAVGEGPQDVTYAPDGRHFYTANVNDGTVSVVDTETGAVTARIPTGTSPTSVAVTPDGRRAFVTNFDDGTVRLLDTASG